MEFNCQRFGTLCLFHLHRRVSNRLWRWNRQSVPKRWQLNSIRLRTTQNKTYVLGFVMFYSILRLKKCKENNLWLSSMVAAVSSLKHRNTKCAWPLSMGRMCILVMINSSVGFPFGTQRLHWSFFTLKCNVFTGTNASGSTCMMHVFFTDKITKCFVLCACRVLEDLKFN
jgi:hypothetical protein